MALSSPSPTVPNDGSRPAERIFSPKTEEVNWASSTGRCNTGLLK